MNYFKNNSALKFIISLGIFVFFGNFVSPLMGIGAENVVYVSEEIGATGNCNSLQSVLNNNVGGTIVLDRECELSNPLTIPKQTTLAGVGIFGKGLLHFINLPIGTSAIRLEPLNGGGGTSHITLRDLVIIGPNNIIGVNVSQSSIVHIQNVRITGFNVGIFGLKANALMVDHSNISLSKYYNIVASQDTANWRIRDSIINQAGEGGVLIKANTQSGHVIDGNIISSNDKYGINTYGRGTMITHNRFRTSKGLDIRIDVDAQETRISENYFDTGNIQNNSISTQCANNIEELDC